MLEKLSSPPILIRSEPVPTQTERFLPYLWAELQSSTDKLMK